IWTQRGDGVSVGGRSTGLHGITRKTRQAGVERFERRKSHAAADFCVRGGRERFRGWEWRRRRALAGAFQRRRTAVGGKSFGRAGLSECASRTDCQTCERNRGARTRSKAGLRVCLPREG